VGALSGSIAGIAAMARQNDPDNLIMIRPRHNPQGVAMSCDPTAARPLAERQRDGWFGSGKADCAGAAAVFAAWGLRGRIRFAPLGGGGAGCSSATTGFGSVTTGGAELKAPVLRITCTCTVCGRNLSSVKVTEKPLSGAGTATEQGVLQPGPSEVTASAPGGLDSS
jgi:hypothetical protein